MKITVQGKVFETVSVDTEEEIEELNQLYAWLYENVNNLDKFKINLSDGSSMMMGGAAISNAVFQLVK